MAEDFITVTISDQDFKIKCSELEVDLLNRSAAYLDIKMSELKKTSPALPKDKIAIMAALNIISDYLKNEDELREYESISKEIESIQNSLNFEEMK